ncbi:uncharacterized protein PB18E9.04c-like [Pecten maximus]|uniref:uncharacterized protein PB18E9.04c-like n=1 Tax=Pecten maximus TaxID=6579 RepID=UPI001457F918|nr:uncharacterized protein PB18E9.04c-like [Pecten maximus]XP_033740618.1 uncharacterized protein PB18E9.04c-like [Pecten maximus]
MACYQQLTFVLSVVGMCFIAGAIGRRSCPVERPTVDICTEGTVHGTETLLVDFSPEVGITSCNCNFTIDGARVNVSTLVAPQNQCEPQLEIEIGIDYFRAGCNAFSESYNIPEIKTGIIWTTSDAFYGIDPPQDLCLEFNVQGGTSTVSITCTVESDLEPSTTMEAGTLSPEVLPPISGTTGPMVDQTTNISQIITTSTAAKELSGPPDNIRDEILKLAKNNENPLVFENVALLLNATDLSDVALAETTSEQAITDVTASSTTSVPMTPPKDVMDKILEVANATANPIHIEIPGTTPLENETVVDVLTTTKSSPQPIQIASSTTSVPLTPPKDVMDKILEVANATSNPIHIEIPSTTPLENETVVDVSTTTTSLPKPIQTSVSNVPAVPPTDVMDQLLDIANNFTSDTIVFPEFPGGTDIP